MDAGERLRWDIDGTVQFILARQCKCIALQLPDEQLAESDAVYTTLSSELVAAGHTAEVRKFDLFNFLLASFWHRAGLFASCCRRQPLGHKIPLVSLCSLMLTES
jgi:hypothetical protein